jgi:hypothetical protein
MRTLGLSQAYDHLKHIFRGEINSRLAQQIQRHGFFIGARRPKQIALFGFSHVATLKQNWGNCTDENNYASDLLRRSF